MFSKKKIEKKNETESSVSNEKPLNFPIYSRADIEAKTVSLTDRRKDMLFFARQKEIKTLCDEQK